MAEMSKDLEKKARRLRDLISGELLADMIVDYKIFETIAPGDTESLALRNYGLSVLANMGLIQDNTLQELVDNWLKIDYTFKEQ